MLSHEYLRNTTIATKYGRVTINKMGNAEGLTEEQEQDLASNKNMHYMPSQQVKEAYAEATKEEPVATATTATSTTTKKVVKRRKRTTTSTTTKSKE